MKNVLYALVAVLALGLIFAVVPIASEEKAYAGYTSLDPTESITFDGERVAWAGKTFTLNVNTIFLDYRLDDNQIADNLYAFNNIQDAAAALTSGTADKPMLLLIAPGVYWVDDPDDPEIRVPAPGGYFPTGLTIDCNYLHFYGLNANPDNVVFASNRGQTQGASGNFTMFSINGIGLKSENVTFGNFCNVDLEFPLAPEFSRKKRAEAIAQAQLFDYRGEDGVAINTNFISRLNLLPFAMTYLNCHLESSGHASFFNSLYIGCSLELYGTNFSAGRFFDCDIYLTPFINNYRGKGAHKFGFVDGPGSGLVCVDTRFHRSAGLVNAGIPAEISWGRIPQADITRSYQHNVTLDGRPYVIQEYATHGTTVVMPEGSELLKAYKLAYNGKTYYNVPNILSGVDPFDYTDAIKAAAVAEGKEENYYLSIPMAAALTLDPASSATIRSRQTEAMLHYSVLPASYAASSALGDWAFITKDPAMSQYIRITDHKNGTLTVSGSNDTQDDVDVIIVAENSLGIEAAVELTVEPPYIAAPGFVREPVIVKPENGSVKLAYELDLGGLKDESLITWYRCKAADCGDPLKVAVTRLGNPETAYTLSGGDVGYYLMAVIQPRHKRCDPGEPKTVYSSFPVTAEDVEINRIDTDFHNLPTNPQPLILPGTWTLDGYFSPDCYDEAKNPPIPRYTPKADSWTYTAGQSGVEGYMGLEQTQRGARLFYTPVGGNFGDMSVRALFAPKKTAGQGFGSATDQFLDVFIKFDLVSMSGYALRIERLDTTEIAALGYNGDGATAGCAFSLIKYGNGKTTLLTRKLLSSAFIAECLVEIKVVDRRLSASVTSSAESRSGDLYDYPREVTLDAEIEENGFGGTGMLFTGTVGGNALRVLRWETGWGEGLRR
ncbi:MAG: hypothetical protein JXR49_14995 [Acidobacteria bacterium]|nr:hypothetical protein [Acidobacteriota bacterium]